VAGNFLNLFATPMKISSDIIYKPSVEIESPKISAESTRELLNSISANNPDIRSIIIGATLHDVRDINTKEAHEVFEVILENIGTIPDYKISEKLEALSSQALKREMHSADFWHNLLDAAATYNNDAYNPSQIVAVIKNAVFAIDTPHISDKDKVAVFNKTIETLAELEITDKEVWNAVREKLLPLVVPHDSPKFAQILAYHPKDACVLLEWMINEKISNFDECEIVFEDSWAVDDGSVVSPLSKYHAQKQEFKSSCAAAALVTIADELGVDTMPMIPGSISDMEKDRKLVVGSYRCERDIYYITTGCKYHDDAALRNAGPSSIPNIIKAAKMLGLNVKVHEYKTDYSEHMHGEDQYKIEKNALLKKGVKINSSSVKLNPHEREMLLVATEEGFDSLHWVEVRPDGTLGDSDTGKNYENFEEFSAANGYFKAGVSLVISKEVPKSPTCCIII
jgi:hypothetical protein